MNKPRSRCRKDAVIAVGLVIILTLCITASLAWLGGTSAASDYEAPAAHEAGENAADGKFLGLTVYDYSDYMKTKVDEAHRKIVRHHKVPFWWGDINTAPGVYDWSQSDRNIKEILADGSESILLLLEGFTPEWARDPAYGRLASLSPPLDWEYWREYCSAVSARYGEVVDFYEIWNEPGWDRDSEAYRAWGVCFFGGQVETEYLSMLRVAYSAIKENDPTAKIVCGDLPSSIDPDPSKGTELLSLLFDDENRPGQNMSIQVLSDKSVIAECPIYLKNTGLWWVDRAEGDAEPAAEWHFNLEGLSSPSYNWLCLENPGNNLAQVNLIFNMARGEVIEKNVAVPAGTRHTLNVNHLLGFQSYCDMVALHDYKAFWNWGDFYSRCVQALRCKGAMQEIVVTEVGCPHASETRPDPYSEELRLKAVGEEGVGGLFEHGCLKIWYYKDIDQPPGMAWDEMYYGLFSYEGDPFPAWEEFKRWQSKLPQYPPLPSSWTP